MKATSPTLPLSFSLPDLFRQKILATLRSLGLGNKTAQRAGQAGPASAPFSRTRGFYMSTFVEVSTEEATLVEQARLIHRNIPAVSIFGFLVATLFVLVFSQVTPLHTLLAWLGVVAALTIFRLFVWHLFHRQHFDAQLAQRWLNHSLLVAALSGTLWGLAAFFLVPDNLFTYQLTFVYAVVMMSVSAMLSYHAHYPVFIAFVLPMLGMTMPALFFKHADLKWGIGGGILIYLVVALRFTWTFYQLFLESLRLRFENRDLVSSLTVQKEAAESANQAKSRFLAAASHDLRQPMHALNLYLGSLDNQTLPENARATVRNVRMCAGTMDKMFRALLDVSQLDAGAVKPQIGSFPVRNILNRIRSEFTPQAAAKGLSLHVQHCSAVIESDPALSERIIRNLVHNAVRYTERGKIVVGCRRNGDRLNVCVLDTGIGIAEDEQKRIFEEFYQSGNPERDRSKGLGLGLAIVQRLANLLDTPVRLRSQAGRGSMFSVSLRRVAADPTRDMLSDTQIAVPAQTDFSGKLIVVIDDEALIRTATRSLLELWGCKVIAVASRTAALDMLSSSPRPPDAILCDYRLSEGDDGIRVIEALRSEFNADIPAVLLTGDTGRDNLREILATGLPVLHKPINLDVLRDALALLLCKPAADDAELTSHEHGLGAVGNAQRAENR